jgi:hypothetical protein
MPRKRCTTYNPAMKNTKTECRGEVDRYREPAPGPVGLPSTKGCAAMARNLVWIKNETFQGFGCSECHWVFEPTNAVFGFGRSIYDMKQAYEAERDKEFAAHVCASFSRGIDLKK